ncbi:MAG: hypothetical protein D6708_17285 [Candidatus Dadabacteria bacterium]|nr:MAG: hypothetical protein D6708_17285 [Candidatus Dadabacteria bacterium]
MKRENGETRSRVGPVVLRARKDRCVQHAAAEAYREAAARLLADAEPDPESGRRVEVLGRFLATADFPSLRRQAAELLETREEITYEVWMEENGRVGWRIVEAAPGA